MNLQEEEVKRELFIIECEDGFKPRSEKSKMISVIKKSSVDIKNWFYETGSRNSLPESWDEFKLRIIDLFIEQVLDSLYRYTNEPWSKYVERIRDKAISTNASNEQVFKTLRRENSPEIFRNMFYTFEDLEKPAKTSVEY